MSACTISSLRGVASRRSLGAHKKVNTNNQPQLHLSSQHQGITPALGIVCTRFSQRSTGAACVASAAASDDIKTVAITGATGLVGSRLVSKLASSGSSVLVLTRDVAKARGKLPYPNTKFFGVNDWDAAIAAADAIINLAGEPISTRWSDGIKQEIMKSRTGTTRRLAEAINKVPKASRPKVFVSSSAVGFYGTSETATFTEESETGSDFLAKVCQEWEKEAMAADTRVAVIRTGIVLSKQGGALGKLLPVFALFLGGPVGTGYQWMSWVHIDDLVNLLIEAARNPSYKGVYNGTAPNPVRMADLCACLGETLGRPSWLPVPEFALQGLLADGAKIVLEGQRVLPVRTQKEGFNFQYDQVGPALRALLS